MAKKEHRQKVIGVPLQKSIQETEEGFLLVRGFFTSDQKDEVGDIITRSATERAVPKYRRWGNIRRMHAPDPVGRVTRIGSEDGLQWNEVEILVIDPKAIFEVRNGLLKALSVGILVDFEDLDFLEDGGWIINDYALAEISLVDHPANYDAALQLDLDDATRTLIREKGLVPALKSLGISPEGVIKFMENENTPEAVVKAEVQPSETPADEEVVAEPVAEEAVSEPAAEQEPVAEAELSADAEITEEAPVAEEEEIAPEAVPAPVAAVNASIDSTLQAITETLKTMSTVLATMVETQKALMPKALPVTEQLEGDADAPDLQALLEENKALKAQVAELSTPAPEERKGAIPTEEIPDEQAVSEAQFAKNSAMSLREAVKRFTESKTK